METDGVDLLFAALVSPDEDDPPCDVQAEEEAEEGVLRLLPIDGDGQSVKAAALDTAHVQLAAAVLRIESLQTDNCHLAAELADALELADAEQAEARHPPTRLLTARERSGSGSAPSGSDQPIHELLSQAEGMAAEEAQWDEVLQQVREHKYVACGLYRARLFRMANSQLGGFAAARTQGGLPPPRGRVACGATVAGCR